MRPRHPILFLKLCLLTILISWFARWTSPKRLVEWCRSPFFTCWLPEVSQDFPSTRHYVDLITACRFFRSPRGGCFVRSVVLFCLLRPVREGLEIVWGVGRNEAGRWVAHAWLEQYGQTLFEPSGPLEQYERLQRFA